MIIYYLCHDSFRMGKQPCFTTWHSQAQRLPTHHPIPFVLLPLHARSLRRSHSASQPPHTPRRLLRSCSPVSAARSSSVCPPQCLLRLRLLTRTRRVLYLRPSQMPFGGLGFFPASSTSTCLRTRCTLCISFLVLALEFLITPWSSAYPRDCTRSRWFTPLPMISPSWESRKCK